ncbi:MAG: DUF5627 domain-containing protein [Dysgonamonadaceae bacterium]|jgi:hypothetical protein|nr:DUF5627 domain-containing protein [Dysgonamonadaceae bacterium]
MKKIPFIILLISVIFSSCENGGWEFPDNDYTAVYFAYQTPVRTITLGTDYINDNSLDNKHQFQIMATVGGLREVKHDIVINFEVDNSLCDNLANVTAMPSNYYELSNDSEIVIKKGSKMQGGVVVTLTPEFFNDPLALTTNYVIPLVMTSVNGADSILVGKVADGVDAPNRVDKEDWAVLPKDYILFAVKYLNPWDAWYLRRGVDKITKDGGAPEEVIRKENSPEYDKLIRLTSFSLLELNFSADNHTTENNTNLDMAFKLDFELSDFPADFAHLPTPQKCTFANGAWKNSQLVNEYTGGTGTNTFRIFDIVVSGTGEYVIDGEKKSWGYKDRDALYLNYTVEYKYQQPAGSGTIRAMKYETEDILVFRDRGVKPETFTPVLK